MRDSRSAVLAGGRRGSAPPHTREVLAPHEVDHGELDGFAACSRGRDTGTLVVGSGVVVAVGEGATGGGRPELR